MQQYQKMMVIGNVGSNPVRTKDGSRVYFDLAYNKLWKNAAGEQKKTTTWYRVWCGNGLANTVENYVRKGDKDVLVEGEHNATLNGYNGSVRIQNNINAATVRFGEHADSEDVDQDVPEEGDGEEIPF